MRRVKIFTFLFFILLAAAFYGNKLIAPAASGQTSLSAPTGVTASDGNYANKIGIIWNAARGATVYRIFRNTTNDANGATDVGTTAANYFFDTSAAAGQQFFYWVRAENGANVSGFSQPDQGLRAFGNIGSSPFPPLNPPPAPAGNPVTAAKAALGKTLFWDEQLSSTKTVSCGTCHRPAAGGSDPRTAVNNSRSRNPGADNTFNTADDVFGSPGVPLNNQNGTYSLSNFFGFGEQVTNRKAPSYLNAGYAPGGLFWDGRALAAFRDPLTNAVILPGGASLESQVLGPPLAAAEMAHGGRDWTQVAARVAESKPLALASNIPEGLQNWLGGRTYPQLFEEAFGTPDVTPARIAMAIATHERTLFSDQTPLDKWAANIEPLTAQEEAGRRLFVNLQCNTCHDGSLLTDHLFHNIGVRPANEDAGRGGVTGNAADNGKFKTPTLRNVELRGPFMHNGRFATLEEVVEFYDRAGDHDAPNIDRGVIRPLNLTAQEKADLVAFMKRPLTDPRVRDELPPFDRPTLYTETTRVPQITGTGAAGAGGHIPQPVAIEPPLVGNPSFTVGVTKGLGGAQAVLVINSTDPGTASIPASGSFTRQTITLSGAGAGNGYGSISLSIPNNPALVGQTFFGRWYVADNAAPNGFSVSPAFRFTIFGEAAAINKTHADFDGDGKTDVSVFRLADGAWYVLNSSNGSFSATQFGIGTDVLAPADFDGDGKTDYVVFRSGIWYLLRSREGFTGISFGTSEDVPQPADFDGDNKADIAVFRPSNGTWYVLNSTAGFTAVQFGASGDVPVAADYDGDGRADPTVFRSGVWYILRSSLGFAGVQFGAANDKPVRGDFDGDGKTDVSVFRPANGAWYRLNSSNGGFSATQFGVSSDSPSPGDYDGDGKSDVAVFRAAVGAWYILQSSNSAFRGELFGQNQDVSVPGAGVP
jgi:cytochrome c peroxidase